MNVRFTIVITIFCLSTIAFINCNSSAKSKSRTYKMNLVLETRSKDDTPDTIDRSRLSYLLEKRFAAAGFECSVLSNTNGLIEVALSGVNDTLKAIRYATANNEVRFMETYTLAEAVPLLQLMSQQLDNTGKPVEKKRAADTTVSKPINDLIDSMGAEPKKASSALDELINLSPTNMNGYAVIGYVKQKNKAAFSNLLESILPKIAASKRPELCYGLPDIKNAHKEVMLPVYFLDTSFKAARPVITNADISSSEPQIDETGRNNVYITFSERGAGKWEVLTRQNIQRTIAVVLNGEVLTAPNVNDVIPNGRATITGSFTVKEAQDIAEGISIPPLPFRITVLRSTVSPEGSGEKAGRKR